MSEHDYLKLDAKGAYKRPPAPNAPKEEERAPWVGTGVAAASLTWRAASALSTWSRSLDRNRESEALMGGELVPDGGLLMVYGL